MELRKRRLVLDGVVKVVGNKSVILAGNRAAAGDWGMKRALREFSRVVIGGWGKILLYMLVISAIIAALQY